MLERLTSQIAIRNRFVMVVSALLIMGAGIWTYPRLPIDAFPDVSPSLVQVFTVTEGLAPEEVEKYVTYPVEAHMTGLPNVTNIRSVSNFGLSVVNVYFEDDTDIYFARQIVSEALQEARQEIPEGFGSPKMGPIATGQGQVLYYYLKDTTGTFSLTRLRTLQDWIVKPNLQTVAGVTEVLGIGGFEKQFHVVVEPNALLRFDVSLPELIERIKANNGNAGAQFIERDGEQLMVRSVGLATGIDDLNNIVVKAEHGRPVYVRDIATVEEGGAIRRGLQTRNGEGEVVAGMAIKLFGTNSSTVISRIEAKLAEIEGALPAGVAIVPFYEQKTLVEASVDTVRQALIQGVALVLLVLLLLMGGLRPAVVVALAIPFSVLFAIVAMGHFEISANLMSLGGLAIAIGMMVDGTIVLVENVDRRLRGSETGDAPTPIVATACREVIRPVFFSIAIIIITFLPLFTLQGVEGKTFRPLAYTVALAMLGSLLFAVLLAPAFCDLFIRRPSAERRRGPGYFRHVFNGYRRAVGFLVRSPRSAVGLAVGLLLAGAAIYPQLGTEFTPRLDEGDIMVNLSFAPSASLTEAKRTVMLIERRFLKVPAVAEVVTRIGRGEVGAHSAPVNVGHMNVLLQPKSQWHGSMSQRDIEEALRKELRGIPGVVASITQPIELTVDELVAGTKADLAIKLFGDEINQLKGNGEQVAAIVRRVRGAADVQVEQLTGAPQVLIRPNRVAIARYGLNVRDIQDVVRAAVGGANAGQIFEGVRRFDVFVRFEAKARSTVKAIGDILIRTPVGEKLPLSQLAQIEEVVGLRQIVREKGQRYIGIHCNVVGRDIGSFVREAQLAIGQRLSLPTGYFIAWGGQFELQQLANERLTVVIPMTLALVAFLLYLSFGSVRQSLLILVNIPLALVGGVVALWYSGLNLSVPASVGFIALFGVALGNGMVLVAYFNQLQAEGLSLADAAIHGACLRLRPVLLTACTTGLGLIPLLLSGGTGSEVQRPLATVVLGGLLTSTALTLLVLPSLYAWLATPKAPSNLRIEQH